MHRDRFGHSDRVVGMEVGRVRRHDGDSLHGSDFSGLGVFLALTAPLFATHSQNTSKIDSAGEGVERVSRGTNVDSERNGVVCRPGRHRPNCLPRTRCCSGTRDSFSLSSAADTGALLALDEPVGSTRKCGQAE